LSPLPFFFHCAPKMLEKYKDEVIRLISIAGFDLAASNQFENIRSQGCISSLFRVRLNNDSTIVVKLTEKDNSQICSELHNREIEFYRWLNDENERENSMANLKCPKYYGGYECVDKIGIILMEDFSSRLCRDLSDIKGFDVQTVFKVVRELAGIQCLHLSSNHELKNKLDRFDYSSSVRNCLPKLDRMDGISIEMRRKLNEWIEPVTLFKIQTNLPQDIQGISPTLIHCDLWVDNLLFCRDDIDIDLLSIIDWQCFKIGNPLLDVASLLGLCMTTEERREYTKEVMRVYVEEIEKRKEHFKRPFHITLHKANLLLFHAFRWPCVQLMTAVVTMSDEEREENGEEYEVFTARLTELMKDTLTLENGAEE
ncbi:hypothetical protein PMAYCL1PPCAC_29763, partial [Pristionchus mayeri]